MKEATTITVLLKGLTKLNSVDEVRRENNCYALTADGKVEAISISGENTNSRNLRRLTLGDEASRLKYLNLSGLSAMREIVFKQALPELLYADLSRCALSNVSLPSGFQKLEQLYLHNNKLEKFQSEGPCPNLLLLDLANNQLTDFSLPPGFTELAYLYLPDNKLKSVQLPPDAKKLNILHLRNNRLEDLPPNLVDFTNIEALYLHGNPMSNLPKQIIAEDERASSWEGVKNYLISLSQGSVINAKAKIILIGNGNVGKTTLSHQLRNNEFIEHYERTHGILIKEWEILKTDFPQNFSEKIEESIKKEKEKNAEAAKNLTFPEKITLNLWDFGGQEYYHATHRLFLNNNVIYLLLWDKETEDLDESEGIYPRIHWHQNISYYAPQNITFFVQNKAKGDYRFNEEDLIYKINHRDNSINQTIQQYNSDILALKSGIMSQFANLEFLGRPFPKVYDDIRNALKNETRPVLLFDEFERLCIKTDNTKKKIMKESGQNETLTNLLHDTGAIICYRYMKEPVIDESLKRFVFTNPEWVTNVIYDILSDRLISCNGEFDDDFLRDALATSKALEDQPSSLSNEDWISLMKSFELIFEVKKGEKTWFVAPQYLPWECDNQVAYEMAIANRNLKSVFTLNYPDYIQNSLLLRFISKYGAQSSPSFIYWKKGLVFFSKGKLAFVEYFKDNGDHKIKVQVQDGDISLASEIFDYFHKHINESTQISTNQKDFVPVKLLIRSQSLTGCNYGDKIFLCKDFQFIFKAEAASSEDDIISNIIKNETITIKEMPVFKSIKIFLASSSELKIDRDELRIFISMQNDRLYKRGVYLELIQWEYFLDAISSKGLQNEYNKALKDCDIVLSLFFTKAGKYTQEEFEVAYDSFIRTGKPEIYTYFKNAQVNMNDISEQVISLLNFKKRLEEIKHFPTYYNNIDDLKNKFKEQLEKLEDKGFFDNNYHLLKKIWDSGKTAKQQETKLTKDSSNNKVSRGKNSPEIFFSYAWSDKEEKGESREKIANDLYESLKSKGYNVKRDKEEIRYKMSITEFMKRISKGDFIVVIVSDKYLKSAYCMFEMLETYRKSNSDEEEFKEKIYPLVLEDAKIFSGKNSLQYVKFWKNEKEALEREIEEVGLSDAIDAIGEEYKVIRDVTSSIGLITNILRGINSLSPQLLSNNDFEIIRIAIEERIAGRQG